MKKTLLIILISTFSLGLKGQDLHTQLKTATPKQRKEIMAKLSPEQLKEIYKKFREEMLIKELELTEQQKEPFLKIFDEYHRKQREVKEKFKGTSNPLTLSEAEAQTKLKESFEVGEQMLENRKIYAKKLEKVLKPQQILKLFKSEGLMREKMMNIKIQHQVP